MNATILSSRFGPATGNIDCPACGYRDALSVSSSLNGRPLYYCHANECSFEDIIGKRGRAAGARSRRATELRPKPPRDEETAAACERKQAAAARLWSSSIPAPGTLTDRYTAGRGLAGLAESAPLRFLAECWHPKGRKLPAMIALVQDAAGKPSAVHRTFLASDGSGKAKVDPPRASLGPLWGGAVRLDPFDPDQPLVIGEGIETAASAGRLIGAPAWAALNAGNLASGLVLPAEVRRVIVAADPDAPGEKAARAAAQRWAAEGRTVRIARPTGRGDFNDLLQARAAENAHG